MVVTLHTSVECFLQISEYITVLPSHVTHLLFVANLHIIMTNILHPSAHLLHDMVTLLILPIHMLEPWL